jgi:hypothetical protein
MKNLVRTSGIPVLAYSTSHADASSCLLLIKYSEAYKQATFLLQTSIPIKGLDDKQTFILQYNADNLVTSDTSLRAVTILLPQTSQNNIARRDDPEMYTLSLSIKEVCPVWCTPSSGLVFPRVGFYSVFNQLAALARATEIHILFDYKWVHHENRGLLRQLIHRSQELTGVPVNEYSTIYRLTDWSVFGPLEAAGEVEDSPPRYTHTSHKRCRDGKYLYLHRRLSYVNV